MKKIVICAGGTGGHINAALSLADTFNDDYKVEFISGTRKLDYKLFKNQKVSHLNGKPLRSKNPIVLLKNVLINLVVFFKIFVSYLKERPEFVIGTGGYICGPSLLVAKIIFIPVFIVEQNAAAGLTNRILSKISNLVFISFKNTIGITNSKKVIFSKNPIRSNIKFSKNILKEKINILVFGGSLGAKQLEKAAHLLSENKKYEIKHQVGLGNKSKFINENYEQIEYIENMQKLYNWSNIIIARSGASTISELEIVKRPSVLVPFKYATDNHQLLNAKSIKSEKLFHVEIIDSTKNNEEVARDIIKSVEVIVADKRFEISEKIEEMSAANKIKESIYEYLK